jgi:hypothetical protein
LVWGLQDGQVLGRDEDLYAARGAGLAADQACTFESEDHLVDGGRGDAEVALYLSFGRRAPIDACVMLGLFCDTGALWERGPFSLGSGGPRMAHLPAQEMPMISVTQP